MGWGSLNEGAAYTSEYGKFGYRAITVPWSKYVLKTALAEGRLYPRALAALTRTSYSVFDARSKISYIIAYTST